MADEWEARSFGLAGSPERVSKDLEADRAILVSLIELAEAGVRVEMSHLVALGSKITPWVAWQLGIFAEHVAANTDYAFQALILALLAGRACGDPARLLANTLTAGNVCFKLGQEEAAEMFYEEILVSPFSPNTPERIGAHMGMANMNFARDNFADAAYYFDKCIRSSPVILEEEGRQGMLANAAKAYLQCGEFGGALVCLEQIDRGIAEQLETKMKTETPSFEERILTVTRLHLLGAHEKVDALLTAWNDNQQGE